MGGTERSYGDFVKFQRQRNPCLAVLADHLNGRRGNSTSTITCLEYSCNGERPSQPRKVAAADVSQLLRTDSGIFGRILFVEDIQPNLVSVLGEAMDIDPAFFAGHIATDFGGIEKAPPPPALALFPSQLAESGYLHVHYQQIIDLGNADIFKDCGYALKTDSGIPRNVRRLPDLMGRQLALARACCSVLVKDLKGVWICLVLVDSPKRKVVGTLKSGASKKFESKLLNDGFEDFSPFSSFKLDRPNDHLWDKSSMLSTLLHYFRHGPPDFKTADPSILSLSYYPVRIALAEWMLYTHLMSRYVKHYQYSLQTDKGHLYDNDIVDLQRWRRRSKQTQHKLLLLTQFINAQLPQEDDNADTQRWCRTLRDIQFVHSEVKYHKNSLEQMVLVATSMVQLRDAANVKRLTYIALVFVPLSWVASLFSMAEDFIPGHKWFWVYFATAVPMVFVLLLSLNREGLVLLLSVLQDRLAKWARRLKGLWGGWRAKEKDAKVISA